MTTYLAKKLLTLLLLLGLVSITVFAVLFVLPGDPAQVILGINATPETLATLRAELGMDKPFLGQYLEWIARLLAGQSYQSIHYKMPVFDLILGSLAVTGPMALFAMVFAVLISLPLGIFAARHQNRTGDVAVMFFTQLGLATPEFWFGILLILLFSVKLGWFAAGGFPGWAADFWGSLRALLLPAFALGVIRASIQTRLTRSSMLEVLGEDYVRTARAKGLTIMGLQLGQLLAGAIIIENVFFLPGLGRLVFNAIGQRDLPVVRDIVLFMAAAVVVVNFVVDLAYAFVDPRAKVK
jgi:peptide/nickel transport system permease protein